MASGTVTSSGAKFEFSDFPGENPVGHKSKLYFENLNDAVAYAGLTSAVTGDLPERVASLIDCGPDEIVLPPGIATSMASDPVGLYKIQAIVAKCVRINAENESKRSTARRDDDNKLFTLICASMVKTAPILRESLREQCQVISYPGFYSGRAAIRQLVEHCASIGEKGIGHKYYQNIEDKMRHPDHHLKEGCTVNSFASMARCLVSLVNPQLSRPYQGESLGEAVIALLPYAYVDAKERLIDECRRDGSLHDAAKVITACLIIVSRRANSLTLSSIDNMTDDMLLASLESSGGRTATPEVAMVGKGKGWGAAKGKGKGGGKGKPAGWEPDCVNEFCSKCPHRSRDGLTTFVCYSNPRARLGAADCGRMLLDRTWYDKVVAARDRIAAKLTIVAVPLPPFGTVAPAAATSALSLAAVEACTTCDEQDDEEWLKGVVDSSSSEVCMVLFTSPTPTVRPGPDDEALVGAPATPVAPRSNTKFLGGTERLFSTAFDLPADQSLSSTTRKSPRDPPIKDSIISDQVIIPAGGPNSGGPDHGIPSAQKESSGNVAIVQPKSGVHTAAVGLVAAPAPALAAAPVPVRRGRMRLTRREAFIAVGIPIAFILYALLASTASMVLSSLLPTNDSPGALALFASAPIIIWLRGTSVKLVSIASRIIEVTSKVVSVMLGPALAMAGGVKMATGTILVYLFVVGIFARINAHPVVRMPMARETYFSAANFDAYDIDVPCCPAITYGPIRGCYIGDTGAGRCSGNDVSDFVPGSLYTHATNIANAAGSDHVCMQRGTMIATFPSNNGNYTILSRDALFNRACPFKLISLGTLSRTHGTSLFMPPYAEAGHIAFPDGATIQLSVIGGVVYFPEASSDLDLNVSLAPAVTRGKHQSMAGEMTTSILHARFKHCSHANLKHIHKVLDNIPSHWADLAIASPCDTCLRGHFDSIGGTGAIPKDGRLVCYDIWQTSVPSVHGGQIYIIVFLHFASGVSKSYVLKQKSDAIMAIMQAYVWFTSRSPLPITWFHTDNAPELSRSADVVDFFLKKGIRGTTIAPGVSRSNPAERRLRTLRSATAKGLIQSKLPTNYWAYAWMDAENGLALVPTLEAPFTTPMEKLTGKKPTSYERPFGCLAYVKVPNAVKVGPDSKRGLCMGYGIEHLARPSQAAYSIYCPEAKRIYVTPHVKFIEDCFPGLSVNGSGSVFIDEPEFSKGAEKEVVPETVDDTYILPEELPPGPLDAPLGWTSSDLEFAPHSGLDTEISDGLDESGVIAQVDDPPEATTEEVTPDIVGGLNPAQRKLAPDRPGEYWHPTGGLAGRRRTVSKYARPTIDEARKALGQAFISSEVSMSSVDNEFSGAMTEVLNRFPDSEVIALAMLNECGLTVRGSPQQTEARKQYAAEAVRAAMSGVALPAFERLYSYGCDRTGTLGGAFDEVGGSHCLMSMEESDIDFDLVLAASDKDIYSYKRMLVSPDRKAWEDARHTELDTLERMGCYKLLALDDPRIQGLAIIDTMFTGRQKPASALSAAKFKARVVLRGDQMRGIRSANENHSPTVLGTTHKCCEAVKVLRGQEETYFDYVAAYIQGKIVKTGPKAQRVIARAPYGHRVYDERGVEQVWDMDSALYGGTDSGAIWNQTLNGFTVSDKVGLIRSDADPCLYSKTTGRGSLITMPVYVDDGKIFNDPTTDAREEVERIKTEYKSRFEVKFGEVNPKEAYFLSKDIIRHDSTRTSLLSTTYIRKLGKDHLKGASIDDFPAAWSHTPAGKELGVAVDEALAKKASPDPKLQEEYGSLVMAMMYKNGDRPDITTAVCMLSRCLHYTTPALMKCAMRVLVYLLRNESLGLTYSSAGDDAKKLRVMVDANWSTKRSTSGFVALLAGAAVSNFHRSQHCIAVSTCEAELMALATAALEVLFLIKVLTSTGYEFESDDGAELQTKNPEAHSLVYNHGPVEVCTDSKSAFDLCHREGAGQFSRHVERKHFKMREVRAAGKVNLTLIPTSENSADMFTKVLDRIPFEKHRAVVMNLQAGGSVALRKA